MDTLTEPQTEEAEEGFFNQGDADTEISEEPADSAISDEAADTGSGVDYPTVSETSPWPPA